MSLSIVSVSGQINYPVLTNKLPEAEYAKAKVHLWLYMLNDGLKPKKWLKPNSKGTKVNYDSIKKPSDYEKGLIDLEEYMNQVNKAFGLDYKLTRD